jgi:hypothetical protein
MLHTLDLKSACNMGFFDPIQGDGKGGWSDEGSASDFRGVETGELEYYGVPVVIIDPKTNNGKSVISLRSEDFLHGPEEIVVPTEQFSNMIGFFVLHAGQNLTENRLAYTMTLEYESGVSEPIEVNVPGQLSNTRVKPKPELEQMYLTKAVPMRVTAEGRRLDRSEKAWIRNTGNDFIYRFPRLSWFENPRKDAGKIMRIRITSANQTGMPIIMAITVMGVKEEYRSPGQQ